MLTCRWALSPVVLVGNSSPRRPIQSQAIGSEAQSASRIRQPTNTPYISLFQVPIPSAFAVFLLCPTQATALQCYLYKSPVPRHPGLTDLSSKIRAWKNSANDRATFDVTSNRRSRSPCKESIILYSSTSCDSSLRYLSRGCCQESDFYHTAPRRPLERKVKSLRVSKRDLDY